MSSARSTTCAPAAGWASSIRGAPGFDFDIQIHMGAGAYICGEGTAQCNSLEGKVGRPRVKPPSMVIRGYQGLPTIVDNVETLAHLTEIALEGGASFARRGTRASTGTKMLSVSGDCERPGIYEYEFGVTIRQVLAGLRRELRRLPCRSAAPRAS